MAKTVERRWSWKAQFIIMFFVLNGLLAFAQQSTLLLSKVKNSPADTNKISLLIQLGNTFSDDPYSENKMLDSSYHYYRQALDLSIKLNQTAWARKSMERIAYYDDLHGDDDRAVRIEKELIKGYEQRNDLINEGQNWQNLGDYAPGLAYKYSCYQKARLLFRKAGDKVDEIGTLKIMGDNLLQRGNLDSSALLLNEAVRQYLDIGYKKRLHYAYDLLAYVAALQGHLNDELFYRVATVKSMETVKDFRYAAIYYDHLAQTYWEIANYRQCLYYALKSYNCGNTPLTYNAMENVIKALQALNRNAEALAFLQNAIKKYPPVRDGEENITRVSFGDIYLALKQNNNAEKNYLQALKLFLIWEGKPIKDTSDHVVHYMRPIRFYVKTGQFKKANYYLEQIPASFDKHVYGRILTEVLLSRFKVDSAFGNYVSAIKNYQGYKSLNDADQKRKNVRNAEGIQNKYERDTKERAIELLESEQNVQKISIQRAVLQRNITLVAILVALILIGFGYNVYRRKQLSVLLIAQKNNQLQILLADNEQSNTLISKKNDQLQALLAEKDWLLKEVHHRVKNNLHTVFCLLESQSKYLSDDALKAIEVSQHRIYAMSLIHQKLYQSDDVKTVDMRVYLLEFIGYLGDSFDTVGSIRFETDIEPVTLDIIQAVPVALIINEAVTNAIKYAFPQGKNGVITVSFKKNDEEIALKVADNGIGIGSFIDIEQPNSLGLILMHGLTDDLHGLFTIKNENGTMVEVVFPSDAAWAA